MNSDRYTAFIKYIVLVIINKKESTYRLKRFFIKSYNRDFIENIKLNLFKIFEETIYQMIQIGKSYK